MAVPFIYTRGFSNRLLPDLDWPDGGYRLYLHLLVSGTGQSVANLFGGSEFVRIRYQTRKFGWVVVCQSSHFFGFSLALHDLLVQKVSLSALEKRKGPKR